MSGLGEAVAFLTPVGRARAPSPRALRWFPAVGAAIGAVIGATWLVADRLWPPLVAAVVVVTAELAITGGLHIDGLADTADGVLPPLERRRRLPVMAAPDVGAFGVATVGVVLLARVAALAAVAPHVALPVSLWIVSRTLMVAGVATLPYVGGGLARAFAGGAPSRRVGTVATGVAAAVAVSTLWRPVHGPVAVAAAAVAGALVLAGCRRRLGGYTGDVLGAAGVVAETVGLLTSAASI